MVDWINISSNSGSGNATITVTASSYSQLLERSTALTVRTATKSAVVGITQRFNNDFIISPETINGVPYNSYTNLNYYYITITSNTSWNIVSGANWLSFNANSGSGSTTVSLLVQDNSGYARTGTVVFENANGVQRTLTVSQVAYNSEVMPISLYPQVINIPPSGGSQTINVVYDGVWSLSLGEGMWAEVSPYSDDPQHASGHGNTTLTITAGPNTGNTSRTVEIWVCDEDCVSGTVVQQGYYVEPSGSITPSTITGSCIQNTTQIQITSNVSWTLEAPDWVYLSQTSGMSGNSITVSLTMFKNASSARSSTIILKSGNTVLDTASISQAQYTTQTFGHNSTIIRATSGGTYCASFPEPLEIGMIGSPMLDFIYHIDGSNPWPYYYNEVSTACWGVTADTKNVYYANTRFYTARHPSNTYEVYIAAERSGCQDRLVTTAQYNVSQGENALFRTNPAIIDSVSIDGNSVALTDLLDMTTETYDGDVEASDKTTFGYNLGSGRHTVIITSIAPIQFWKIDTLQSITLSGSCVAMSTTPVVGGQFYVGGSKVYTESFYGCSNLQSVTLDITDSSCVVEKSCKLPSFRLCTSLTNITIPSTITEVDGDSFDDSGIVRIYLQGTIAPSITGHALHRLPQSGVIHAPTNADYYSYANWESQLPDGWSIVYDL